MHITLSPLRMDESLTASREGDVLILNGEPFDFSQLPEGAKLPAERVVSPWIIGFVTRINGELHLTLRLPHGPDPSPEVAFPQPIHVAEGGPVEVPQ